MTDHKRADAAGASLEDPHPTMEEVFARVETHTGGRLTLDEATAILRQDRERR